MTLASGASGASDASDASGASGAMGGDYITIPSSIVPEAGKPPINVDAMLVEIYKQVFNTQDISGNTATGARRGQAGADKKLDALSKTFTEKIGTLTTSLEGLAKAVENAKHPYGQPASQGGRRRTSSRVKRLHKSGKKVSRHARR